MKQALLSLTVSSSFEGGYAVTLFKNYELERVRYSLYYDASLSLYSKPNQSVPKELPVSTEDVERILVLLTHPCAVFKVEPMVGLDGTTFELRIQDGFNEARYTWWCGIPEGWETLGKIANALLQLAGRENVIE